MEADLISQWLSAPSEKERARIEAEIWKSNGLPSKQDKRTYFTSLLGGARSEYEVRAAIYAMGPPAEPLWQRIHNKEITIYGAKRLLTDVKKNLAPGASMVEAVAKAAELYDRQPVVITEDGWVSRKLPDLSVLRPPEPPPPTEPPKEEEHRDWKQLRAGLLGFFDSRLDADGVDFAESERIKADVHADVEVLIKTMQSKLNRTRQRRALLAVNNVEVRGHEACQNLHIDWPGIKRLDGDFLKKAKLQRQILAREYHSDTGGPTADPVKFTAVLTSYEALEQLAKEK